MRRQFVLTVLAALALAQTQALADKPDTTPVSVGPPHVCANYLLRAIAHHAQGKTVLDFRVAIDGTVKDLTVSKSSGDDDLDAASAACAQHWQYKPATHDGTPVEAQWQASVDWHLGRNAAPPLPNCAKFVPADVTSVSGVTTVSFGINDDGSARKPRIAESSGNDALDQAALSCVAAMKLNLTTRAPPSDFRMTSEIDWAKELAPPK
jgi:TonB family protein